MPNAERTDRISARAYLHIFEERDDAPSIAAGASLFQMQREGAARPGVIRRRLNQSKVLKLSDSKKLGILAAQE